MSAAAVRTRAEPAQRKQSGEVIILPKHLQVEWLGVISLDPEVPHVALRVACAISTYLNGSRGDAYPNQETLARVLGVSKRTIWSAVKELEDRGYLLVKRRELGQRESDGRRVCGGRGVANTYLPAFERSQVTATNTGQKLATHCDLLWEKARNPLRPSEAERSQNGALKDATGCVPTYYPPTEGTYARTREAPRSASRPAEEWLRKRLGEPVFTSWFRDVQVEEVGERSITLSVPSKFRRAELKKFESLILEGWQQEYPQVDRVEVVVRPGRAGS